MTLRIVTAAALLGMAALFATPVLAESWGAIAYSGSTGRIGYTYENGSEPEASENAIGYCGVDDCETVVTYRNACGAVAVGTSGNYAGGWGETSGIAQDTALVNCSQYDEGCAVQRWQCSNAQ